VSWCASTILQSVMVCTDHTTKCHGVHLPYYKVSWCAPTILQSVMVYIYHTTKCHGVHLPYYKVSWPKTQKSEHKFKWKLIETDFTAVVFYSVVYYPAFRMPTWTLLVYNSVLLFTEYLRNFKANSRIFVACVMPLNTFYGFWCPHNCEYFGFSLHLLQLLLIAKLLPHLQTTTWVSYGRNCQEKFVLGWNAVQCGRILPTFLLLHIQVTLKTEAAVSCHVTWCNILLKS